MGCGASRQDVNNTEIDIHPDLLPVSTREKKSASRRPQWIGRGKTTWSLQKANKSDASSPSRKGDVVLNLMVKPVKSGEVETTDYRMFFEDGEKKISPWHDIPLFPAGRPGLLNCIVEIPRGTRAKLEVATHEKANPIMQDTKKGKLRYYGVDPIFNYGCFPQTWEDPSIKHEEANCVGDGDPVDVVEIGERVLESGTITQVKPLGVLCMIDDGEADWKVIAIDSRDPNADRMNDIDDVETIMPGIVSEIREWFRTYKTHEGKPLNTFGLNEEAMGRAYTLKIVQLAHDDWARLWMGITDKGEFET